MSQNNFTRNTTKSPTIRKLLLTGLILLILVGLLGPGVKVEAQAIGMWSIVTIKF